VYATWTPHDRWAASAKYTFERFDTPPGLGGGGHFLQLRTHRVPLDVRYFATQGVFAQLTATRIFQRGLFTANPTAVSGEDRFWVVDASVGFRIPRRYGRFALEMKNLFDEKFSFQDTDPANPIVRPGRLVVFSFTVGI
jgi:outer membrane receptor for monomeric catechols